MKQTAVEWLENQIKNSKYFYKLMEDIQSKSTVAESNILEQAKLIEIDQMRAVHLMTWMNRDFDFEQYIKEHYESNNRIQITGRSI